MGETTPNNKASLMALRAFSTFMGSLFQEGNDTANFPRYCTEEESRVAQDGEKTCCICFVNVANTGFIQCHTQDFCGTCVNEILRRAMNCPLCRREVMAVAHQPLEPELPPLLLERFESEQFDGVAQVIVPQSPEPLPPTRNSTHSREITMQRFNAIMEEFRGRIRSDLSGSV